MGVETAIMAGVSLAGAGLNAAMSSGASGAAAESKKRAAYARVQAIQRQKEEAWIASDIRVEDIKRNIDMTIGKQITGFAGRGVRGEGSVISNTASTAALGARDIFYDKYKTAREVDNLQYEADSLLAGAASIGEQARAEDQARMISLLGGAGLSAVGSMAGGMSFGGFRGDPVASSMYGSARPAVPLDVLNNRGWIGGGV